jgi:pyruvate/2-oxoglutarate dehydrogenase complex dihydrolipoamide acyltransferase (E2) component
VPESQSPYTLEPRNPFFEVACSIIRNEIEPRNKVTFFSQVDLTQVEALRERASAQGLHKPSYTALVAKAVAIGLRDHPYANRRVVRGWLPWSWQPRIQRFLEIDVTVAVERKIPGAEMVAFVDVLRNVDAMGLQEVTSRLRELSEADAENNRQWKDFSGLVQRCPSWLAALLIRLPTYFPSLWVKYRGGAAMVSAPGKYGVDTIAGNWWAPIGVSFGVVKPRPVVHESQVVSRPTFNLTLNFDVRLMAGAQAAQFCKRIQDVLEQAETELKPWLFNEPQVATALGAASSTSAEASAAIDWSAADRDPPAP